MPDDYVKRSDVHKVFQPKYAPAINRTFAAMIDSVPAADVVEVRHGRWHDVYLSSASSFVGTCSVCGKSNDIPPVPLAKYCPSCGAKMDGVQDND